MREEKKYISEEYLKRLNSAAFVIVVDYQRLLVDQFSELRNRLFACGAELHVVKNSIFALAAKEVGLPDLKGALSGQLAAVTGSKDVSAVAKILKNFAAEFERPKVLFGFLDGKRLEAEDLAALADLPSIEVLRGKLLGVIQAPATKLAQVINTPGTQVARVLKAKVDQG